MGPVLTERRQFIMKLVVADFIEHATAVSSEAIVRKYALPISSATVRNEMAALEELGYLTHPHTSAGRIPTDAGYRFFVEHLMDEVPIAATEQQRIREQFCQVRGELDQLIQLGANLLAQSVQNASVVTPPRSYQARFKHLELIAINDVTVILVLVLDDGTVRQQTLVLETMRSQDDLRLISARINERCGDASVSQISALLAQEEHEQHRMGDEAFERQVLQVLVRVMAQVEEQYNEHIHSDGLIEMLSQPEFLPSLAKEEDTRRAVDRMRHALEIVTSGKILSTLILRALASDTIQVVIGTEHDHDEMHGYSVVLSRYGIDGTVGGVIGIIGPTRMAYPRSIPTVRYISSVMSSLVGELYGIDPPASTAHRDPADEWRVAS